MNTLTFQVWADFHSSFDPYLKLTWLVLKFYTPSIHKSHLSEPPAICSPGGYNPIARARNHRCNLMFDFSWGGSNPGNPNPRVEYQQGGRDLRAHSVPLVLLCDSPAEYEPTKGSTRTKTIEATWRILDLHGACTSNKEKNK